MATRTDGVIPRELYLIDGNSLAYRAFFALPESIATSDGRPSNAIFGFASMLVKILTEFGDVPCIVVWDAGMSGRKEISEDYKAQRTSRPPIRPVAPVTVTRIGAPPRSSSSTRVRALARARIAGPRAVRPAPTVHRAEPWSVGGDGRPYTWRSPGVPAAMADRAPGGVLECRRRWPTPRASSSS